MKKYPRLRTAEPPADPRRRELLLLAALAGSAGLAWPGKPEQQPACLLSLREADFYARHELAG